LHPSTGIGYYTVLQLARQGAKVYLGARSEQRAKEAIEKLHAEGLGDKAGIFYSRANEISCRFTGGIRGYCLVEPRFDISAQSKGSSRTYPVPRATTGHLEYVLRILIHEGKLPDFCMQSIMQESEAGFFF
jgi:hypothetical protein